MNQYKTYKARSRDNNAAEAQPSPKTAQKQDKIMPLPKDMNGAIKVLMKSIKDLESFYEKETTALEAADTREFMKLQHEKVIVAKAYQNHMGQMMARKSELAKLEPSVKDKIREMHNRFSEKSQKNLQVIERMQRSTERLGNSIRLAAVRSVQSGQSCGYSSTGAAYGNAKRRTVSAGTNETV